MFVGGVVLMVVRRGLIVANKKLYPCSCVPDQFNPLCPACFTRTTSVQILPEHQLVLDRFPQITIREALEIGIDVMERLYIAMTKEDNKDKLLKEQLFYDSHQVKNKV